MSLICCTSRCVYQQEGICTLERAASMGTVQAAKHTSSCMHFIPTAGLQNLQADA